MPFWCKIDSNNEVNEFPQVSTISITSWITCPIVWSFCYFERRKNIFTWFGMIPAWFIALPCLLSIEKWLHWLFGWTEPGNIKGGSITVPLTSCLTGLEWAVWQLKFFVFIWKMDKCKPVKQEVNSTVILPL
jgi:hypothetical protein